MAAEEMMPEPLEPGEKGQQAERVQPGSFRRRIRPWRLWLAQALGAIALFWGVEAGLKLLLLLYQRSWLSGWFWIHPRVHPLWPGLLLIGVWLAAPWLLDYWLNAAYGGLAPLDFKDLATYSPEAEIVLRRCRQQWHLPQGQLKLLSTPVPVALSYGSLRRFSRIVLSQGLLEKLTADEIAAIVAAEMAHLRYWDFALLSLVLVLTQIPYRIYLWVAEWGDGLGPARGDRRLHWLGQGLAALIATGAYGLFRLGRWPGLWLSRVRLFYSDRLAVEVTGNPNGLTRALLKLEQELNRESLTHQGSELITSFALLLPVGDRRVIVPPSSSPQRDWPALLRWELLNPYRNWLGLNQSHPLLGDRLQLLKLYALHWQVVPVLDWPDLQRSPRTPQLDWKVLLLQGAPYFGTAIGVLVGCGFWLVGWLARQFGFRLLFWLFRDAPTLMLALGLVGWSMGLLLQINAWFPELKPLVVTAAPGLSAPLTNPMLLPGSSLAIALEGTCGADLGLATG